MVASVSLRKAVAQEKATLPRPAHHQKSKKTSCFFGIATCADAEAPTVTSTRVESDTSATLPRLWRLVLCASPGQVSQQFAVADGFDNRCVSCSEPWKGALGHQSFEDFAAHANTTAGSSRTPMLAPSLTGFPSMYWPRRRGDSVLSVLCWERDNPSLAAGSPAYQ